VLCLKLAHLALAIGTVDVDNENAAQRAGSDGKVELRIEPPPVPKHVRVLAGI